MRVGAGVDDGDLSRSSVRLKKHPLTRDNSETTLSLLVCKREKKKLPVDNVVNIRGSKLSPSGHDQIIQWSTVTLSRDELL